MAMGIHTPIQNSIFNISNWLQTLLSSLSSRNSTIRTITLQIAADLELRTITSWEQVILQTIKEASDVFEKGFNIRFQILDIAPWEPQTTSGDACKLIEILNKTVSKGEAMSLLGFSGRQSTHKSSGGSWGAAGDTALVMTENPPRFQIQRANLVIHELAHLFGAFHVINNDSYMATTIGIKPLIFDDQNSRMIKLMRNRPFPWGKTPLSLDLEQQITSIYQEGHVTEDTYNYNPAAGILEHVGKRLYDENNYFEATMAFRRALHLAPHFHQAYYRLGITLNKLNQIDDAISAYKQAIRLNPLDAASYSNLGHILIKQPGKRKEALELLMESVKLEPHHSVIRANYALALKMEGNIDEAVTELRKAVELDPNNANGYALLGLALIEQGKNGNEAIRNLQKAITLNPNLADPHANLGRALAEKELYDEAIYEFRKAIRLDPEDIIVSMNLGLLLALKGLHHEAVFEFKRCVQLDPANDKLRVYLAKSLKQIEQTNNAIKELFKALAINPKNGEIYLRLAEIYYSIGEYSKAWSAACSAQKLNYQIPSRVLRIIKSKMSEQGTKYF